MVSVFQPTKSAAKPGAICPMSSRPRFLAPPWMATLSTLRQFTALQAFSSVAVLSGLHACHADVLDNHLPKSRTSAECLLPQSVNEAEWRAAQCFPHTRKNSRVLSHLPWESNIFAQLVLGDVRVLLTALCQRAS